MARPTLFTEEVAAAILDHLTEGQSLRAICRAEGMPSAATWLRWVAADPELVRAYKLARELQADAIFDDVLEIADDARNDWMERHGQGGEGQGWALNGDHVRRSALRVDARKWMLARMAPKKYGDKLQLDGDGEGGPINARVRVVFVKPGEIKKPSEADPE